MKKVIMRQYWRLQQSQTVISMVFWTTTLTLLIWPYVSGDLIQSAVMHCVSQIKSLASRQPISARIHRILVLLTVLLIGYIYDVGLGLWKST